MKKLVLAFTLIIGLHAFSQEKNDNNNKLSYKSEGFTEFNTDKSILTLTGNAELKTSVFEFVNADKIVINTITKEVVVSGNYTVKMNDGTIQQATNIKKNILKYKIGENIAYME